ncbi:hypothetical protein D9757_005331 [Collybiopsis confluens]|uniref:NAD(P)-binding protein n=1 Tax=Collybiopsis confluens TaxID=2823264 RepID=A0A8H5M964_9AGAR|nr:hypothetical protein D9757_005331 [Collybiopsis confluens]
MTTALAQSKIVVITGASRGIGRSCAQEFAKHGATGFLLHYYGDAATEMEIRSLKQELLDGSSERKVEVVPGDIADPETSMKIVSKAVEAFGRIDVLVSNAVFARSESSPHSRWILGTELEVNLDGSFYITQAVAKQMKDQSPQGGALIGISSISAWVGGEFQVHYTPTKAGILSLMQSCAVALGKYGIRANAVLPGTIATDINKEDLSDVAKREGMISRTCLGRLGQPEDIAGPVVFLASDLAKYITGSALLVDGGLFVNLQ